AVQRASDLQEAGLHDTVIPSADLLPDDLMGVGLAIVDPVWPGDDVVPHQRIGDEPSSLTTANPHTTVIDGSGVSGPPHRGKPIADVWRTPDIPAQSAIADGPRIGSLIWIALALGALIIGLLVGGHQSETGTPAVGGTTSSSRPSTPSTVTTVGQPN